MIRKKSKKSLRALVFLLSSLAFTATVLFTSSKANAATLSLTTTKNSAVNGEAVPVNIKLDTSSSDIVVTRAIIRYNKSLFSVATSDVDLTGSVFNSGNTCVFPSDYSDTSLRDKPCQIITNDTTNGILSITLATPSHVASTNPGAQINGADLQVALVNFHALGTVSTTLSQKTIALQYISPIGGVPNGADSDVILDEPTAVPPAGGTDVLASVGQISSAMYGDLNMDGIIDISDFSILKANFDNITCNNVADIIGNDCSVDITDFSQLKANFDHTY